MNLRQLLALPLALALAWVLAAPFSHRLIYYRWAQAVNQLNGVALDIDHRFAPHRRTTVDCVQRWINGQPLQSDPHEFQMASPPENDPWGNPLQAVERIDDAGTRRIAVFSLGRDGASATNGEDPDDINSWADDPVAYYQREAQHESRMHHLSCTIPLACVLYAPMCFLLRTRRKTEPWVATEAAS